MKVFYSFILFVTFVFASKPPLSGCDTFHENSCQGNNIVTPDSFEDHRWYTPIKGDAEWRPSFQDYGKLVANAHVEYSSDMQSATVDLRAKARDGTTEITYWFDGKPSDSPVAAFDRSFTGPLAVAVSTSDAKIELEPVDFVWNAEKITPRAGDFRNGQKGAIVELFGWPHAEIEKECPTLAKLGYLGLKVFPPQEQVMSSQPFNGILNPWYFSYQPVSYRLQGRMGTRDDLRRMINACRRVGVRVYADAVVNHMVGCGNDGNPHHRNGNGGGCTYWPNKNSSLLGGPSPSYTQCFAYTYGEHTDMPPSQEFPAVPYGPLDFHCERPLNAWTDPLQLNAGWLTGLCDINTERENVRERIADYFTDLIGIGFSGFRIDAAKHICPDDLVQIFSKLKRNLGGSLPVDFISWLEVLLGGEADLLMCNPNSGYNYGSYLADKLSSVGKLSAEDVTKIKIWNSGYPKETDKGLCTISAKRSVIQNDDHDQQNPGSSSRDMGNQGCVLIKGCSVPEHRAFEQKLFENPNGISDNDNDAPIRLVLSSFYWPENQALGYPDGLSDCSLCTITCDGCRSMPKTNAYDPSSCGYDSGVFTRVHRDSAIVNSMRRWMHLSSLNGYCQA